MSKLRVKTINEPAIEIHRQALQAQKLVYIASANKAFQYPLGRSHIVYIGTTKAGADRIAASASAKAKQLLSLHGVKSLQFYVVTCASRQNVETWRQLERGLLCAFKYLYGAVPKSNIQGKNHKWGKELHYFHRSRLEAIVEEYAP